MSKTLDFNSVKRQTLNITMQDEAKTKIHVAMPTENMVEELQHVSDEFQTLIHDGDADARKSIGAIYDLAARLISRNRDMLRVTAEDLQDKYQMDLEDLFLFFNTYLDFVHEVSNEKN